MTSGHARHVAALCSALLRLLIASPCHLTPFLQCCAGKNDWSSEKWCRNQYQDQCVPKPTCEE